MLLHLTEKKTYGIVINDLKARIYCKEIESSGTKMRKHSKLLLKFCCTLTGRKFQYTFIIIIIELNFSCVRVLMSTCFIQ